MNALGLAPDSALLTHPAPGAWTYADWERLPADGNRYEVVGGVLYMTTAPSNFHQWIVQVLVEYIALPARQRGLAYSFFAPIGVLMDGCDPVQPDFVVIRRERAHIIREGRIRGVPDLIIEVLSPSNRAYDEQTKRAAYAQAGVPEYALIDPAARALRLYRLTEAGAYAEVAYATATDSISFACLPDILLPIAALFAGAPDTTL
ncbi:MAG: Uma2 family endonuclease [Chloroflexaceae bacterium]|nr:Uma2 family endonuclease [Chloroflexaceae bacterium]